jgi:hypothetical protein
MTTIAYILDQCRKKDARPNLQPLVSGANLDRHVRGSKGVTGTIMECSIVIQGARAYKGWGKKITGLVPRSCSRDCANFGQVRENSVWDLDLYILASQLAPWLLLRELPQVIYSITLWLVPCHQVHKCQAQGPWEAPSSPSNVICLRFINESINEVPVRTDVRECAINVWYVNTARHALRFIITRGPSWPSWPSRRIETRSF